MKIEGVIFDFNGTLFKDGHYHELAWQIISEEITGKKMTIDEIRAYTHGVPNEITIDRLSNQTFNKEENLKWSQRKEALYRDMVMQDRDNAKLVPGAERLFDTLQQMNIPFNIASASIIENIEFFFEFFNLNRWFKLEETIYDNGTYVNKIAMFNEALEILSVPKENTLIFEDSSSGYQCAIDAGFKKIIMIYDDSNRLAELNQLPNILKCIKTFDELLKKEIN